MPRSEYNPDAYKTKPGKTNPPRRRRRTRPWQPPAAAQPPAVAPDDATQVEPPATKTRAKAKPPTDKA
jgi:hypothetical protein